MLNDKLLKCVIQPIAYLVLLIFGDGFETEAEPVAHSFFILIHILLDSGYLRTWSIFRGHFAVCNEVTLLSRIFAKFVRTLSVVLSWLSANRDRL